MAYSSSTATQTVTTNVAPGATSQQIIGLSIDMGSNCSSAQTLSSLTFNTNGTTNESDIQNATVWYTGNSSTFATTTQFGLPNISPSGTYTITGNQTLTTGINYFWLAYDISTYANLYNVADAQCTSITVGVTNYTPSVTDPGTGRTIDFSYCTYPTLTTNSPSTITAVKNGYAQQYSKYLPYQWLCILSTNR